MAYVPPHKRHSRDGVPSPTPASLAPLFNKSPSVSRSKSDRKIVYADHAVHKWFAIGLRADQDLLSSETIKLASVDRKAQGTSFMSFPNDSTEYGGVAEANAESPWSSIARLVLPHLISSFQALRSVGAVENEFEIKPDLVARFGKIVFRGSSYMRVADVCRWVSASSLESSRKTFSTHVPSAYVKEMTDVVVPKIGLEAEDEKDVYHVWLSDKLRPDATISCKCHLVKEEQKLELHNVKLNMERHMVVDVSCLKTDMDLRLMLCAKRAVKDLSEEERTAIADLVGSAIIDCDVKGGLRWPLGKNSSGYNRYAVVGVWHIISKIYRNSSFKLKVRRVDRSDFQLSTGQATREVTLKMREIACALWEQNPEAEFVSDMLVKLLKQIWEHFLQFKDPVLETVASV